MYKQADNSLGLTTAVLESFKISFNIIKVMIPVSFAVMILNYFGLVKSLSQAVSPFFNYLGLPGEAVFALISGYIINCYSAFAVIATLSLTGKELTILSVMLLLCHTLPVELSVQKKAGGPFWLILGLRLGSSLVMGLILNCLIPDGSRVLLIRPSGSTFTQPLPFDQMMVSWIFGNIVILKIVMVNIAIIIFYTLLKRFNIITKISNFFKPLMRLFGLPEESAFLWIIANVLGLIAGAAMLIEAKNNQGLNETGLKKLNISLATCHALVQETANFYAIGGWLPFLILSRIIVSVITVRGYSLLKISRGGGFKNSRQKLVKV